MHPLHGWLRASRPQRQQAIRALFGGTWPPVQDYAELVKVPGQWGVFASLGPHFHYAVFGRDSIETAEDLVATHPALVHDIILALCRLQGTTTNPITEEEPGKIHHEHRTLHLDGFTIPPHSQRILHDLQQVWGGLGTNEMTYYGSHDATPLFVRLVGRYVARYGGSILDEQCVCRNRQPATVRACAAAALAWLTEKVEAYPPGLFAYQRLNPQGIANQDWKDSQTSHLHADGSLPNFTQGIASIEMQGYAYDAFRTGITLRLGTISDHHRWAALAHRLQQQTLRLLWWPDAPYFAQALDIDHTGRVRQLATVTSDPAALLDSHLLHDLPAEQAVPYIQALVRMVYSPELLTPIGIRSRAVRHWALLPYIDYHGPNTVWPKETFDIAKGFRRAGLPHLAADLERRLAHSLEEAGEFSEFFYVSRDGKVWYDRGEALAHFGAESPGQTLPVPEPGQAWTIAAAIRIASQQQQLPPLTAFEHAILSTLHL